VPLAFAPALIAAALFVWLERRSPAPLVPPALFASRTFVAVNVATFLLYGALAAIFYELPFAMIQGHGYTALQSALASLPMMAGLVLLARTGAALGRRFGPGWVLTAGPLLSGCGFAALGRLAENTSYAASFLPGILLLGIGMGITVAPLTTAAIDAADPGHVGVASGINSAVARVAGLLAIALFTSVLAFTYASSLAHRLAAAHATPAQTQAADEQNARLGGARFTDPLLAQASRASFLLGFRAVAYGCAALALLAAITSAAGVRRAELGGSEPETG
jgi:preprotein translocase subunit SecG